ncbi:hypothetical protein [Clostridium folliculivorans]|uniref:Uncharacterized protein n=1 Tax=Clostridium folliculivorans TaxID=2886038 RepID=A0A9W5Y2M7_9CLOT|nr:hypothetical protein [Clostridium folliculivorans]GKU25468.1 hypothetical protein CFOLD11_22940 [Clostridium folliculivorans]GKU28490.1 hypothetical protein CFB3_05960 [Clostridium folliculivorans]
MNIKRKKILITLTAIISIVIISSFLIIKSMVIRFNKSLDPVTLININWSANLPNTNEATVLSDKTGGFPSDGVKLTKLNYSKDHLDELNKSFNFSSFDSLALDRFNSLAKSIDDKKAINEITDLIINDNSTLRYKIIKKDSSYLLILISTKSSDTLSLYCLEDRI